jgi:hypothetical protein
MQVSSLARARFRGKIITKFDRMNYGCPELKIQSKHSKFRAKKIGGKAADRIHLCSASGVARIVTERSD